MRARNWIAFAAALAAMTGNVRARAAGPSPLPPLPVPAEDAAGTASAPGRAVAAATCRGGSRCRAPLLRAPLLGSPSPSPPMAPAPPQVVYARPPRGSESMAAEGAGATHAPHNALWLGARLGFLAYGGGSTWETRTPARSRPRAISSSRGPRSSSTSGLALPGATCRTSESSWASPPRDAASIRSTRIRARPLPAWAFGTSPGTSTRWRSSATSRLAFAGFRLPMSRAPGARRGSSSFASDSAPRSGSPTTSPSRR